MAVLLQWIFKHQCIRRIYRTTIGVGAVLLILFFGHSAFAIIATTTVTVSICGNGITDPGEICDDGAQNGTYGTSTETRFCNTTCNGYAQYCGDGILQPIQGETCDDLNNVSGDGCDAQCISENLPPPSNPPPPRSSGGGGGGFIGGSESPTTQTKIVVSGKAYPDSDVHILKDGETIGVVEASAVGDFHFETTNVTPGVTTFGFWAEDPEEVKSIAFTVTLQVTSNAVSTISGVFLPPTITLDRRAVQPGDIINISGYSIPDVTIATHVNSSNEIIEEILSGEDGKWELAFDTDPLQANEFHTAKARFRDVISGNVIESVFSQSVSFFVGDEAPEGFQFADLNQDGSVNLIDFSILLFYWGTASSVADLNSDGKVDLTDFSVLLFHWTG